MTDEDRTADRGTTTTIDPADGHSTGAASASGDSTRISPFEVTATMVAADFAASGGPDFELPAEMLGTIERIWQDRHFTWPTTVSVLEIGSTVDDDGAIWSTVSVLGTGWAPGTPVALRFDNAFGRPGDVVTLPSAESSDTGFFGVDVSFRTLPRRSSEWIWDADRQVGLVAEQTVDGETRTARQAQLPAHTVWRWVR